MPAEVRVIGVGAIAFARRSALSESEMAALAIGAALRDAAVPRSHVEAMFVGNVFGAPGFGQTIARDVGFAGLPVINIENACASATCALLEGAAWIHAGMAETVLVVGVEKLSNSFGGLIELPRSFYKDQGLTLPALYALHARRLMERDGLTAQQLAAVTVKSRALAKNNPIVSFADPVTIDEVLDAPMIADPLTRLMCCPNADGAAAAVISGSAHEHRRSTRAIRLAGSALASGRHRDRQLAGESVVGPTAVLAYERAGVAPGDVDVAEVHDAFAVGEILAYERLGFCAAGAGGSFVPRAYPNANGTAVNPSGGLLSRGHPPGATGLAQVYEVVRQLRREVKGGAQVDGARVGLTLTMGGTVMELETNACAVHVFTT
jgi:acetyl-CoA acetyltransferase